MLHRAPLLSYRLSALRPNARLACALGVLLGAATVANAQQPCDASRWTNVRQWTGHFTETGSGQRTISDPHWALGCDLRGVCIVAGTQINTASISESANLTLSAQTEGLSPLTWIGKSDGTVTLDDHLQNTLIPREASDHILGEHFRIPGSFDRQLSNNTQGNLHDSPFRLVIDPTTCSYSLSLTSLAHNTARDLTTFSLDCVQIGLGHHLPVSCVPVNSTHTTDILDWGWGPTSPFDSGLPGAQMFVDTYPLPSSGQALSGSISKAAVANGGPPESNFSITWDLTPSGPPPPCTSVQAPAVQLIVPPSKEMGQPYDLTAHVVNTDPNCPISFLLQWNEHYTFPTLNEPEQGGSTGSYDLAPSGQPRSEIDLTLKPGAGTQSYTHTWQWLGPNAVGTLEENLVGILEGLITEGAKLVFFPITGTLVEIVSKLDDAFKFLPETSKTTVIYTARVFYGPVGSPLKFSAPVPSTRIELVTSSDKKVKLTAAKFLSVAGKSSTSLGLAIVEIPPAAISFFLAQVAFLVDARIAYNQAADPPDPNFTELAVPTPIKFPELDALPDSFWKLFAQNVRTLEALDKAEAISNDRALGASIAGDRVWESAQLNAAAGFSLDASAGVRRVNGMLQVVQPFVEKNLQPHAQEVVTSLQNHGLPELEVRYLTQLGWSVSDLTLVQQGLVNVGPRLIKEPKAMVTALTIASLTSAATAIKLNEAAIHIKVDRLGQSVTDITQDDLNDLNALRAGIENGLAKGIPSPVLLRRIEDLIRRVRRLLADSNNLTVLSPVLDFGLRALLAFQQSNASITGLQDFVGTLDKTGGILNSGVSHSLQAKLIAAQKRIADGHFDSAQNVLGAFIKEVRAQGGKAINRDSANDLTGYASYLRSLMAGDSEEDDRDSEEGDRDSGEGKNPD